MNCASRADEVFDDEGWNQNPASLSGDTTTRAIMNGSFNARDHRDNKNIKPDGRGDFVADSKHHPDKFVPLRDGTPDSARGKDALVDAGKERPDDGYGNQTSVIPDVPPSRLNHLSSAAQRVWQAVKKFGGFIGPGKFLITQNMGTDAIKLTTRLNA